MKVNSDLILRNIYGKHILMPVRKNDASDDPVVLNDVAADIWLFAEQGMSFDEIVAAMARKYDLEKNSVEEASVRQFICLLTEQKLLFE